jgi:hypothetical protein
MYLLTEIYWKYTPTLTNYLFKKKEEEPKAGAGGSSL